MGKNKKRKAAPEESPEVSEIMKAYRDVIWENMDLVRQNQELMNQGQQNLENAISSHRQFALIRSSRAIAEIVTMMIKDPISITKEEALSVVSVAINVIEEGYGPTIEEEGDDE